jgi:glycosyltransferase involved in cell wall biosynthesis
MTMLRKLTATPTVSVIVTAYNYADYLPRALDSVLAQDYPADRLEVIVVDDGSTDATPAVLEAYAGRVRAIHQPNGGVNAATTTGMEAATGDLLTFLDGDDEWPADRVRVLVDALRATPAAGLAYGDMEVIDADGTTLAPSFRAAEGVHARSGQVLGHLVEFNFISGGAMMVRAELKDRFCPIPAHGGHQDWWIVWQVASAAEVVAIPQVVNRYRRHGANANLGNDGAERANVYATEIPFRRWLLGTVPSNAVGLEQLLGALSTLDRMTAAVAQARGITPEAVLGVTPEERAQALAALGAASAALDEGSLGATVAHLVAATAHDPSWFEPRTLLAELVPVVQMQVAEAAASRVRRRPARRTVRDVAIAVDYFHPSVGGSERLAEGLGVALLTRGYRVRIATRQLAERTSLEHRGLHIHEVGDVARDYQRALAGADALICLSDPRAWPLAGWTALSELPGRVVAVPCINAENHAHLMRDSGLLAAHLARLGLADSIVYSSHGGFDAALLRQTGMEGTYVPNAVDRVTPAPGLRARLGLDSDAVLVLAVGNLWAEQNHLGLLDALAPLPDGWALAIAGAPAPGQPELAAEIARRAAAMPGVHLLGPLAPEHVSGAMDEATVLVLPSLAEATPLVLVEAMSHGLPWLATPGVGSARDHAGGQVLEVAQFRAAIAALAADPGARAELGAAGREHWEAAYCWDAVAPRYAALLEGRDPGPAAAIERLAA